MEEFDLNSIWKKSEQQANAFYQTIEPEVLEMARQKSNSILRKLKRTVLYEWIANIILYGIIVYLIRGVSNFGIVVAGFVLILLISSIPYWKMLLNINSIPIQDTVHSIKSYINVLSGFVKELKTLVSIVTIISFLAGLVFGFIISANKKSYTDLHEILSITTGKFLMLSVVILILLLLIWGTFKWYIPKLYDKPRQELEALLKDLQQER